MIKLTETTAGHGRVVAAINLVGREGGKEERREGVSKEEEAGRQGRKEGRNEGMREGSAACLGDVVAFNVARAVHGQIPGEGYCQVVPEGEELAAWGEKEGKGGRKGREGGGRGKDGGIG